MALEGSFYSYATMQFGLYCKWSGQQSQSGNYTNITLNVYLRYNRLKVSSRHGAKISINGESETYSTSSIDDLKSTSWKNVLLKSKTVKVVHNADGTKTGVKLSASWPANCTYGGVKVGTITASATVDLDPISVYKLTTSAGTGSNITVNRTSSGYAAKGNISNGAKLYSGDKLKITFTPSQNYAISTHTVNNSTFTSGNTHTVSNDVSVKSTAQVLASSVGATDANIGSTSTITVTRYNTSYYHTLQYSFGKLSGYITNSGNISTDESRFTDTSIPFAIPTSFYEQIPNDKTGICTITCKTYSSQNSTTQLGSATSCKITITASPTLCSPSITTSVVDTNETTIALTGDSSKLIRYKSTALCTLKAVPKNSASISSMQIGGTAVSSDILDGVSIATKSYSSPDDTSFSFSATDSRGYTTLDTIHPTIIAYIELTCNPILSRPTPTGNTIVMDISGSMYRGSFGAYSNSLILQYRYKESGGSYGSWQIIDPTNIVYGTSTYRSSASITLGDEFDYRINYEFQIRATDGASDYTLSTVTKRVTVKRGIPVFDWGENDFNINVPLMLNNVNIFNIIYPIGTVYMHNDNTLPTTISSIGTWESVATDISGVYAWERKA